MASTEVDLTAANAILKELYDGQIVQNMAYETGPFFAMVEKDTGFGGKYKPIPIITSEGAGVATAFSTALTNEVAPESESFLLTRKRLYRNATIDNETMLAAASDRAGFITAAKLAMNGAITSLSNTLCAYLYGAGTGSLGKISAISSGVITLTDTESVVNFARGQIFQVSDSDGGAPRDALGYVISVNRDDGKLTVSTTGINGSAGTPTAWAANDFLMLQGTRNAVPSGLNAWLPATAPSAGESFYGVDRSVDQVRLAGVRHDGASQPVKEAFIDAARRLAREGGKGKKTIFTNYKTYAALEKSLGTQIRYANGKASKADISFTGIELSGPSGPMEVYVDRFCPGTTAFMLELDTWKLESLKAAPHVETYSDGHEMLRVYNSDASQARIIAYCNLSCNAPGFNARITTSV